MSVLTGTLAFNQASAAEQELFELAISSRTRIGAIWIDPANISGITDVTFRLYLKLGANGMCDYREICAVNNSDAITHAMNLIANSNAYNNGGMIEVDTNIKVTAESAAGGGCGSIDIYYRVPYALADDVASISGDSTAADNIEADYDGTGYNKKLAFADGAVHADYSGGGTSGTTFPTGTAKQPTDTLNDAISIAGANNLKRIYVNPGTSERSITSDSSGKHIIGTGSPLQGSLSLALQQNSIFENLKVKSTEDMRYCKFINCSVYSNLYIKNCHLKDCRVYSAGVIRPYQTGVEVLENVDFGYGAAIDMTNAAEDCTLFLFGCKGDVTLQNMGAFNYVYIYDFKGKLTLAASVTAGQILCFDVKGQISDAATAAGATVTFYQQIPVKTKTAMEDILQLMYARLAGKNQLANTGASDSHLEIKLYDYTEASLIKTLNITKPAGTNNTQTIDTNAMAGQLES